MLHSQPIISMPSMIIIYQHFVLIMRTFWFSFGFPLRNWAILRRRPLKPEACWNSKSYKIYVRSSYSQRKPIKTQIGTQALTIASSVLYHWAIPLSHLANSCRAGRPINCRHLISSLRVIWVYLIKALVCIHEIILIITRMINLFGITYV